MVSCWLSQTGAIFVLLATSKPCIRFRWSLYRFQPKSTPHSVALLVFQVEARFNRPFLNHAYASHIASRISWHVLHHVVCALHRGWLWFPFLVFLLWVEPVDECVIEEPVEYAYEDQAYINSENFAGKMTIPSKSLLSLLARCSLFCYAYATISTTCLLCLPYCHVKPLTHLVLANGCLAMLPLCSAPFIALLVAGEDGVCSLLEHDYCWDIIIISCLL